MTTIWASEHGRLHPGHRTTDTDCEDCGARLPMHVAGEGEK